MNWFYESNGQPRGPISDAELDQLVAKGEIIPTTLVWREGLANWQPLQSVRPTTDAGGPAAAEPPPSDAVKCDSCGRLVSPSEIIQIGERAICAACKPAVLQQIQQSGGVTMLGEARNGPAWEHREQIGFVKAAWDTIKSVLTKPVQTFETMKRDGGLQAPFLYAFIIETLATEWAILASAFSPRFGFAAAMLESYPFLRDDPGFRYIMDHNGQFVLGMALLDPICIAAIVFILAGIFHLSLMLCASLKQPFETSFRGLCYTRGSLAVFGFVWIGLAFLPYPLRLACKFALGLWFVVLLSIAMAKAHEINTGNAVLSVLLPFLVCCCLLFIFGAVVGSSVTYFMNHPGGIH
jgi:hypothetical protein